MKNYALLEKNVVVEIIPEFDPIFPNTPIEQRYPADVVRKMISVDDGVNVHAGMLYDPETGAFTEPVTPPPIPMDLNELKAAKIDESKIKLAEWLEANPMTYIDGKKYTVTQEKQALLNANLASYERAVEVNVQYPLKWNATGEECVSWEYRALIALSLAIADYVSPKVAKQQAIECKIMECTTIEELNDVAINYD